MLEDAPAFHYLKNPATDDVVRRQTVDGLAFELDGAVGHLSIFRRQEARDGFEGRRLPRTVRAEKTYDLTSAHFERKPAEDEHDVVVDDLDVI